MTLAANCTQSPLDQHLIRQGWSRLDYAGQVYQLGQGPEAARLESVAVLSGGTRWRLDAPAIALPDTASNLAAHSVLAGPLKFVDDGIGGVACVADLPAEMLTATGEYDFGAEGTDSPLDAWAQCLTAATTGSPQSSAKASSPAAITKVLEAAGYTASIDGDGVKATLVLPGRFAEVSIEPDQPCGLKLSIALAKGTDSASSEASNRSPAVAEAIRCMAQELNRRLPLVRVAQLSSGLTAEVRLTMTRVHDTWLLAAMESLAACALLAVRPLAALQDPALVATVMDLN